MNAKLTQRELYKENPLGNEMIASALKLYEAIGSGVLESAINFQCAIIKGGYKTHRKRNA